MPSPDPLLIRMRRISIRQKVVLILFGIFVCAVLLEIGLRIGGGICLSLQKHKDNISIKRRGTYRIMCLGESTTALGGEDSYPSQLETILNQQVTGVRFEVINAGVPGVTTRGILSLLQDNLDKYNPDMVIVMMGINDSLFLFDNIPYIPSKAALFFKSLRTYKLALLLKQRVMDRAGAEEADKPEAGENGVPSETIDLKQPGEIEEQYRKLIKSTEENLRTGAKAGLLQSNVVPRYMSDLFTRIVEKAVQLNPGEDWAYVELGRCYWIQRRYDKAEAILKRAMDINPENYWIYIELGRCYRWQGKYDQAEEMFRKAIEINPGWERAYANLAGCYKKLGKYELADEYLDKANRLRDVYYSPATRSNFKKLGEIVPGRGIKLVCVQYPVRSVASLKRMFEDGEGIIFVDNEKVFKEALERSGYDYYFVDMFGGDFGHCTPSGNRLLAGNIADHVLRECFNQ